MLEQTIRERRQDKDILLMTHIVLGYPSFNECERVVGHMVDAGVDLMELQIPFSEPIADGPVLLAANQDALAAGSSVARCMETAARLAEKFPIPFLFMTYFNIPFRYGPERFFADAAAAGMRGAIVPDVPLEEGDAYLPAMDAAGLDPIFIFAPNTPGARMRAIAEKARGFVYCVARAGVTGQETTFSQELDAYLARCRDATPLPLALGFGVKDRGDVEFLTGKVDIAVIGSQTIRVINEQGVDAVGAFIRGVTG
jgi:tryptophan synthase alpha chain